MLKNGLGEVLLREAPAHNRFFDLFTGSGAVASYVAGRVGVPVYACDLQAYGAVLASAVICRVETLDVIRIWRLWQARASRIVRQCPPIDDQLRFPKTKRDVEISRRWCSQLKDMPITQAYGGHYYSAFQSIWIDALRKTIPSNSVERSLALAALIDAASECAASPGHTAQPFQPTISAKAHLFEAWRRNVSAKVRSALNKINNQTARTRGTVFVGDAMEMVQILEKGDLVFIDPPYSALHYSRFYHVLESVALGYVGEVEGIGRYPPRENRPRSSYSVKKESLREIERLLASVASKGADAIVTFPNHLCSNGLSGAVIKKISEKYFETTEVAVKSRLSTLGGVGVDDIEGEIRGARRDTSELILIMRAPQPVALSEAKRAAARLRAAA